MASSGFEPPAGRRQYKGPPSTVQPQSPTQTQQPQQQGLPQQSPQRVTQQQRPHSMSGPSSTPTKRSLFNPLSRQASHDSEDSTSIKAGGSPARPRPASQVLQSTRQLSFDDYGSRPQSYNIRSSSRQSVTSPVPDSSRTLVDPYSMPREASGENIINLSSQLRQENVQSSRPSLAHDRRASEASSTAPSSRTLPAPFRSVASLTTAYGQKEYITGPMVQCTERNPDGTRKKKSEWIKVWAHLAGSTLSVWDMKAVEEANARGAQAPPSYINITDAFIHIVNPSEVPLATDPSKFSPHIFSLNTAGTNLVLFSCPDRPSLISWIAAIRLALWEKSRIGEIYTGHLLRMTFSDPRSTLREGQSTLLRGRLEGWVQVRIAGQTEWKRVWAAVNAKPLTAEHDGRPSSPATSYKRSRMSSLFSTRASTPPPPVSLPAMVTLYASPKPKDRKMPLLTLVEVTQAFAIYPERPEIISMSSLIKVEGKLGTQPAAYDMKGKEGWLFIMPESPSEMSPPVEMLKWILALHDAFELYGRPKAYTWDPYSPLSLFFGYPSLEALNELFLDREAVETVDARYDRMSIVRTGFLGLMQEKVEYRRRTSLSQRDEQQAPPDPSSMKQDAPQLPKFDFGSEHGEHTPAGLTVNNTVTSARSMLTTITERDSVADVASVQSTPEQDTSRRVLNTSGDPRGSGLSETLPSRGPGPSILDRPLVSSPPPAEQQASTSQSPPAAAPASLMSDPSPTRGSEESYFQVAPPSRPDSRRRATPSPDIVSKPSTSPKLSLGGAGVHLTKSHESLHSVSTLPTPIYGAPSFNERSPHSRRSPGPSPAIPHETRPVISREPSQTAPSVLSAPLPSSSTRSVLTSSTSFTSMQSQPPSAPAPILPPRSAHRPISPTVSTYSNLQEQHPRPTTRQSLVPPSVPVPGAAPPHKYQLRDMATPSPTSGSRPLPNRRDSGSPYQRTSSPATSTRPPLRESASWRTEHVVSPVLSGTARSRELPTPPVKRMSSIDYATMPPSNGPGIVERLQRQIAEEEGYMDEAGALYIAQKLRDGSTVGHTTEETDESVSDEGSDMTGHGYAAVNHKKESWGASGEDSPVERRQTTTAFVAPLKPVGSSGPPPSSFDSPAEHGRLGRKPSGARDRSAPTRRVAPLVTTTMTASHFDDDPLGADALAALTFAENAPEPPPPTARRAPSPPTLPSASSPQPAPTRHTTQDSAQFPSSFTASKAAAERKAKAQAIQAASQAALHQPGRAAGKARSSAPAPKKQSWDSSDEEEDEEEEEDDEEDDGSDDEAPIRGRARDGPPAPLRSQASTLYAPQAQHQAQLNSNPSMAEFGLRPTPPGGDESRRTRNLPSIPRSGSRQSPAYDQRSGSFDNRGRPDPSRTYFDDDDPRNAPPPRIHNPDERSASRDRAPPARANIWSSVLDPNKASNLGPSPTQVRDTFVTLEPSETMTKAFAPQGLLQAGLADKQDRSAKRQEELARESGSSYVNVPTKPPPPQSGLLGAITAHERERKRDGGMGAALTERERERRLAEERQRKIDELQRQQLEYAQQTGGGGLGPSSPYDMVGAGGGFNPMMNPMMLNPMMMPGMMPGMMSPMMGGGLSPQMTGYQPPGWGMSAQQQQMQMFAAQQAAADAYRNAMVAFSQAGSVAASEVGGPAMRAASPMMGPPQWGGGMNTMSMYGMPPQMTGQPWGFSGTPQPDFGGRMSMFSPGANMQPPPDQAQQHQSPNPDSNPPHPK